jgi:hypothetical protein
MVRKGRVEAEAVHAIFFDAAEMQAKNMSMKGTF